MPRLLHWLTAIAFCLTTGSAQAAKPLSIGVRTLVVSQPERGSTINITLWYPAASGGILTTLGGSKIFEGVSAYQDAPLKDGKFPLVLLSHGGMRSAPHLSNWIAAHLAGRNYIVAEVRAPALKVSEAHKAASDIWLRPTDLSTALEAAKRDTDIGRQIDIEKVGVLGLQLGGTAALALAGAKLDPESYMRSCDKGGTGVDCHWFKKIGVDLHKVDPEQLGKSHLNSNIKVAIAIDPEVSGSFTPKSLARIAVPVALINLGNTESLTPGLSAVMLQEHIPEVSYHAVAEATRFSAFSTCTPKAVVILQSEGDDGAICQESGTRSRADIHAELVERIEAALKWGFTDAP